MTFECQINPLQNNQKLLAFYSSFFIPPPPFFLPRELISVQSLSNEQFFKAANSFFKVIEKIDGLKLGLDSPPIPPSFYFLFDEFVFLFCPLTLHISVRRNA